MTSNKEVHNMFKEHEKFWAFATLVLSIMVIALISVMVGALSEAQLRLLEKVNDGMLVVLGAAGMSLFRTNENAKDMNDILRFAVTKAAEAVPPSAPPPPADAADAAGQVAEAATETADRIAEAAGSGSSSKDK